LLRALRAVVRDETGQGLAEYGLICLLVAAAAVGALQLFGNAIVGLYAAAGAAFP
jgi:Flp pilus assembly pilin Flp